MVTTATYYEVFCDRCGEAMNDYDNGESAWKSEDEANATMNTLGWKKLKDGICLCPECIDDYFCGKD